MDRRSFTVVIAAVILRLVLFTAFPSLPNLLTNRVELSTPVTSFKRLQEGLFLYTHGLSPYDGGVFHQAPLLLAFFTTLPSNPIVVYLVYILSDVLSAYSLIQIATSGVSVSTPYHTSSRKSSTWPPWAVAVAFLFNPFSIATCIARPTIVFTNTAILTAIAKGVKGHGIAAVLALAMASYLSLYPVLLLPPMVLLAYDSLPAAKKVGRSLGSFAAVLTAVFTVAAAGLGALSWGITGGSWEFLASTYGVHLLLPDLTPNVGLWWYFFIEMFDSFREFFLCVFQLHLAVYLAGLCLRLRKQPLFVITTLLGISSIFKSYPSIGDTALYLSLLSLYRHIFPLMRYTFFVTSTLLYATLLGPAFYYLWIYAGSGNANFFYAITLVWSLAVTVLVSDAIFAVLRDEWETERPEMKGKEIVQI
ncbi:PIG-U-domain-containing protein [Choiromyces venosus 120613-1]|uniref:PIG-U-domain-containing protein n=1 Tax=Choiromyces venosus 120613-1 TaxID=1336337 RepID=A0A3N4JCH6_9PEZI|nr:PIG-U-domain-containing protein [Choiromyces venosus 120613-1]